MIYLDHAATTPLDPQVLAKMKPHFTEKFGNTSSIYQLGQVAKNALEEARGAVAKIINAHPAEIIFTSGGTESNNLALRGMAEALAKKGKRKGHLIVSKIEHHAILHTAEDLEKKGFKVTYLDVDKYGLVDPAEVKKKLNQDTILISIMTANDEIGVIQPIREIGKIIRKFREGKLSKEDRQHSRKKIIPPYFHTDAVQAGGVLDLNTEHLKVDLLSLSGHKFYGPKGAGLLFARAGVKIKTQILGGAQEDNRRAGTSNTPGLVGLAAALKLAWEQSQSENTRLLKLRDQFIKKIKTKIKNVRLNGHPTKRLPNNVNISIYGVEGESLLLRLDFRKIAASSGSACTSGSLDPSHVLIACGLSPEWAHSSLRFTLGKKTTKKELDTVANHLEKIVKELREISPIY